MAFLKQNIYKQVLEASKSGNPKASRVLASLRKGEKQDVVDNLVNDLFNGEDETTTEEVVEKESEKETEKNPFFEEKGKTTFEDGFVLPSQRNVDKFRDDDEDEKIEDNFSDIPGEEEETEHKEETKEVENPVDESEEPKETEETKTVEETKEEEPSEEHIEEATKEEEPKKPIDYTETLDRETEDLFDENEIPDLDFSKYLSNKRRDALRASRGADYFRAFSPEDRKKYVESKKQAYADKFAGPLHNIDRSYNDYMTAIDRNYDIINAMEEDEHDLSVDSSNNSYRELTDNPRVMSAISRYWDSQDNDDVFAFLQELMLKYGKQNVLSALGLLKSDVEGYRDFRKGQIDEEIDRYGKTIEKTLG